jgi:DNA (cytosine-5)-methyltransferase 1
MRYEGNSGLSAVSLFSNCGAGDLGFARAGFSFDVMAELDSRRLEVALLNHPQAVGIAGDLRETLSDAVDAYRSRRGDQPPALLAACPPCQGMSSAQSARGDGSNPDIGSLDRRNLLVEVIASAIFHLRPRIVVVENVQAFLTRQVRHPLTDAPVSGAKYLIDTFSNDYVSYPLSTDLATFGVPQSRKRSFITFIRADEPAVAVLRDFGRAPYPRPSHVGEKVDRLALMNVLSSFNLPSLDAVSKEMATSLLPMHSVPVWSSERYAMVAAIPKNSGRSAWENDQCINCDRLYEDRRVVICECGAILPRPVMRAPDGTFRLISGFHSSYRRMHPNLPAATITTGSGHIGCDRTLHPFENRVLSPLECALLQTIPRSFKWGDALAKWGHTNVRAMIGEAVPPMFTRKHGAILSRLLTDSAAENLMPITDRRVNAAYNALRRASQSVASPVS